MTFHLNTGVRPNLGLLFAKHCGLCGVLLWRQELCSTRRYFLTNQTNSNAHLSHPIEFTKLMIVGGYDGNEANANNSYYRTAETIDFAVS